MEPRRASLELGVIGNGSVAALVDDRARIAMVGLVQAALRLSRTWEDAL